MALTAKKLDQVRSDVPVQEVSKDGSKRININVGDKMRKDWKKAALERDMTVTDLIVAAVEEYLRK